MADHYLGNIQVKADGVVENWTDEKLEEYAKCMRDPIYFAKNYVKIISLDEGLVPFELYPYQEKMFKHFKKNRFSIVLSCRQSGKSISSVVFLLWSAIFQPDQTIAILAQKGSVAQEMLGRITLALENLPFFLQPGCKALNKTFLEFSNNSRIISASTSSNSIRGFTVNLLFLDEFAFVERSSLFYTSTYPVITSGKKSKVIITSTANGVGNTFHKLWSEANEKANDFKPLRVDWWDVPGRDEEWKKQTIRNTSRLQFEQEFGNEFHTTGDTLINGETLMKMRSKQPIEILEGSSLLVYEEPKRNHQYVVCVDVAKGRGQDYSTFNVIDISARPFRQVAVYRNNTISPLLFPDIIYKYSKLYNMAYVIIENNDEGMIVCNGLNYDLEYENIHVSSSTKSESLGVFMNKSVKRLGCSGIKDLLEEQKLELVDEQTIIEFATFVAKQNTYKASEGNHDDIVMNYVLFGWFSGTTFFKEMTQIDVRQMMYEKRIKQIEDDIPPFGFIQNNVEPVVTEDVYDPWGLEDFRQADGNVSLSVEDWEI